MDNVTVTLHLDHLSTNIGATFMTRTFWNERSQMSRGIEVNYQSQGQNQSSLIPYQSSSNIMSHSTLYVCLSRDERNCIREDIGHIMAESEFLFFFVNMSSHSDKLCCRPI